MSLGGPGPQIRRFKAIFRRGGLGLRVKVLVEAFNQEKVLVGAFSVITKLRVDLRFKL